MAFGDLFLEDVKKYRERHLGKLVWPAHFPIWKRNTSEIMRTFLNSGFKAVTVFVDLKVLARSFVGRIIDKRFLDELPPHIDLCGENGEFHTFVFVGPIFNEEVKFSLGELVVRNGLCFCDLLPR